LSIKPIPRIRVLGLMNVEGDCMHVTRDILQKPV
jgi:hypothetical protein